MKKNTIVVVGAGFGGITAALALAKKLKVHLDEYEIILIDRHHHQLYTPALYEIAAIPAERAEADILKTSILIPIADIIGQKPITFLCDEFISLETREKKILLKNSGALSYEFLVLALGSETNHFGIPGLAEHSYPLKTFDDAIRLRNTMEDLAKKGGDAEVVIGGAGASGVEVASEFINFFCAVEKEMNSGAKICNTRLTLVEASGEILPGFKTKTVVRSRRRLTKLGIRIRTGTRIERVNPTTIIYQGGEAQPYNILIWTGGVAGHSAFKGTGLTITERGTLVSNRYLEVEGGNGFVFAIGDSAGVKNQETGKMLPGNIPVAEAEAKIAARNIVAAIAGSKKTPFMPAQNYPFVLALGSKYAIADLAYVSVSGLAGWCIKQLIELRYLLSILPFRQAVRIWRLGIKIYSSND